MPPLADTSPASRIARAYVRFVEALAIAGISVLTIVAVVQVFYRYVLNDALFWSEELMRYLMIWVAFLAAGVAYSRGELLGMRFLVDALPKPVQQIVDLISRLLIVLFLAAMFWYGIEYARRTSTEEAIALQFSLFWIHIAVAVGALIMMLHVVFAGVLRAAVAGEDAGNPKEAV